MPCIEATMCLLQIITYVYTVVKNYCDWWKGTSRDKATLISEEIKYVSESVGRLVSQSVNQSVEKSIQYKISWLFDGIDLKIFLGLAMPSLMLSNCQNVNIKLVFE